MTFTHETHVLVGDDPQSFATELLRLYGNNDLWHQIQDAGYNFVEEHYSWTRGLDICNQILRYRRSYMDRAQACSSPSAFSGGSRHLSFDAS